MMSRRGSAGSYEYATRRHQAVKSEWIREVGRRRVTARLRRPAISVTVTRYSSFANKATRRVAMGIAYNIVIGSFAFFTSSSLSRIREGS